MIHPALLCFCLLLVHESISPGPLDGAARPSLQDLVEIETVAESLRAELPTIGIETTEILLEDRTFPIRDILAVSYQKNEFEAQPRDLLVLRNQSRWRGSLVLEENRPEDTVLWATPSLKTPLTVPLDDLVLYSVANAPADPFPTPDANSDQLLTQEGAILTGILEELSDKGVRFDDPSLGSLVIPWSKVVSFRLVEVPVDDEVEDSSRIPLRIRTLDRSDIRGHLILLDAEQVAFSQFKGQEQAISLNRVIDVRFDLGRVIPLTQREPITVREGAPTTTWFPWTWKKDRNVLGNPMHIGGIGYEMGIGVHSRSELTYSVQEGDQLLTGIAGMDISSRPPDQQEGIGCAEFSILVDGEKRWDGGVLSWKSAGIPFRVPLEGAKTFSLIVDLGPGHHILDRANWAQIRIVRK